MNLTRSDVQIQIEEVNLILRFAVARAGLGTTERAALRGFLMDRSGHETAAEIGRSQQAINKALRSGLFKIRKELHLLGIRSTGELLCELDQRSAGEPDEPAVWTPKKRVGMDMQQKKLAFYSSVS